MIKRMNRNQIMKKLEILEEKAPHKTPFLIFVKRLGDGTLEAVEHIRNSIKKGIKIRKKALPDDYLNEHDYSHGVIIMGEEELED